MAGLLLLLIQEHKARVINTARVLTGAQGVSRSRWAMQRERRKPYDQNEILETKQK